MEVKYLAIFAVFFIHCYDTEAQVSLVEPKSRMNLWIENNPSATVNAMDAKHDCGGVKQHRDNDGKCGVCGDNFKMNRPRPNENGGSYGSGTNVRQYRSGSTIIARVNLTENHEGYFEFALCKLEYTNQLETEECFDANKLEIVNGCHRYPISVPQQLTYSINLRLPTGLTCDNCVLRWQWVAQTNPVGIAHEPTFRDCADISIN